MRRPGNWKKTVAWIITTAGIIVIASLILPSGVWWFLLGAALIACGLRLRNCR